MSVRWEDANTLAHQVRDLLRPACERIEIAGSVRRVTPTCKDIELVAISRSDKLYQLTDALAHNHTLPKRDVKTHTAAGVVYRQRWGKKQRVVSYKGIAVEIWIAESHNFGNILLIRTGPKDANEWLMRHLIRIKSPVRTEGGYWRWNGQRLATSEEADVFKLFGFRRPLAVAERTIENYQMAFRDPRRKWPDFREFVIPEVDPEPEPQQLSLL